ncbi:hypothetical protein BDZ91DRAFT_186847 [Kalaharituber pfeilii]|nr:hypothetical protein BDZ91DRAFT_186847 [Kalaharituber pfeilii]
MFRPALARTSRLVGLGPRFRLRTVSVPPQVWFCTRQLVSQSGPDRCRPLRVPDSAEYSPIWCQLRHLSITRQLLVETRDLKREAEVRKEKLRVDPDAVSTTSTVTPIFGEPKANKRTHEAQDVDMLAGIISDLRTIRDTFRLQDVPREVFYIGMVGLVPYVATTFSTLFLAWDLKNAHMQGASYVFSVETMEQLMRFLEPVQVGYGAVILSFLGAIHWGLEFAGYGGRKSVRRYAVGLVAPALAWPTLLLPYHEALLTQFIGFTAMYFFDTAATTAGLAPPWYNTYRFVLTFVVGASIVITLIGRGQIGDNFMQVPSAAENLRELREKQRLNEQKEAEERLRKLEVESYQKKSQDNAQKQGKSEDQSDEDSRANSSDKMAASKNTQPEGGVKPGDENEPIREEMRSKPSRGPAVNQGPEPSAEKKTNVKPMPERKG